MALLLGKRLEDLDEDVMTGLMESCWRSCWVGGRGAKNQWVASPCSKYFEPSPRLPDHACTVGSLTRLYYCMSSNGPAELRHYS